MLVGAADKMEAGGCNSSFWRQAKPHLPCCGLCVQVAKQKPGDEHYMELAPQPWVIVVNVSHPEET